MLVLSRRVGETILVGPDISITIARIGPASVRVAISAPEELNIVREELLTRERNSGTVQTPTGIGSEDKSDGSASGEA